MKINQKVIDALSYAKQHSPFYKRILAAVSVDNTMDYNLFQSIPFTTKEDLSTFNTDFRAVPLKSITEYATTSGTSGKPVTIYLTKNDLNRLAHNEASSLRSIGATEHDVVQLMTTIDRQFMAGLAYYLGVQEIGAGMVRLGPGVPQLQWQSIIENQATILIAVPSFIVSLLNFAEETNIYYKKTSVRKILCIGEPLRDHELNLNILGKRIKDRWDVELYSTYASTEMSAAFTECKAQNGGHLMDDLLFLEVLNEEGEHVKDGSVGEIVVTTLGNEGTPLIRYKTGDLAHFHNESCQCGKLTPRLGPIVGRKNQMIKFKGTTIYPNAIFDIFDLQADITLYKIEVAKDYLGQDTLTVLLPKSIETTLDLEKLVENCKSKLKAVPHFLFLEDEYLRNQVFMKHRRKPEKIVFK